MLPRLREMDRLFAVFTALVPRLLKKEVRPLRSAGSTVSLAAAVSAAAKGFASAVVGVASAVGLAVSVVDVVTGAASAEGTAATG